MNKEVTKINIWSFAFFMAQIGILFGALISAIIVLFGLLFGLDTFDLGTYLIIAIFNMIIFGIAWWYNGFILAVIYNFFVGHNIFFKKFKVEV